MCVCVSHYGGRSLSLPWCRTHVLACVQIVVYPLSTARCQSLGILPDGSAVLSVLKTNKAKGKVVPLQAYSGLEGG
jgi:uncharacterized membrane protein YccF (DUF307 family)